MSKFYIYHHLRNDTGQPFYVGKGFAKRAWSTVGRNRHWQSIVNKHNYAVEIVIDNLTEQEAFECERMLIADYRSAGHKLANKTDGGEGVAGYKFTDQAKRNYAAGLEKRAQNLSWRKNLSAAAVKRSQATGWYLAHIKMIHTRNQKPEYQENHATGIAVRTQDFEWRANQKIGAAKRAQNPDRAKKISTALKIYWAKRKGQDNE